jgi:putative DNA primase/helicase
MNYNTELINFLQTAAGWAISGNTKEQVIFILYGSGANGKSTFLNTIMNLLGDYAMATPTETFMPRPR